MRRICCIAASLFALATPAHAEWWEAQDRPFHRLFRKLGQGRQGVRREDGALGHVAPLAPERQVQPGHVGFAAPDGLSGSAIPATSADWRDPWALPASISRTWAAPCPSPGEVGFEKHWRTARVPWAQQQDQPRSAAGAVPRIYPPFHVPAFHGGLSELVCRRLRRDRGDDRPQAGWQLPPWQPASIPVRRPVQQHAQRVCGAAAGQHQQADGRRLNMAGTRSAGCSIII